MLRGLPHYREVGCTKRGSGRESGLDPRILAKDDGSPGQFAKEIVAARNAEGAVKETGARAAIGNGPLSGILIPLFYNLCGQRRGASRVSV